MRIRFNIGKTPKIILLANHRMYKYEGKLTELDLTHFLLNDYKGEMGDNIPPTPSSFAIHLDFV